MSIRFITFSTFTMTSNYGDKSYWDRRYGGGTIEVYDWYANWQSLAGDLLPQIHATHTTPLPSDVTEEQKRKLRMLEERAGVSSEATKKREQLALSQKARGKKTRTTTASSSTGAGSSTSGATGDSDTAAASPTSITAPHATASAIVDPATSPTAPTPDASNEAATAGKEASAHSSTVTSAEATISTPICPSCTALRVLIVGCGNSELSASMYHAGFHNLLSVDYSEVVINKMKRLYRDTDRELANTFHVADVRDMRSLTPTASVDIILDKGTLDAILCGVDSNKHAASMLAECHRILKPGGSFLLLTYGQPTSRLPYLERKSFTWTVTYRTLGKARFMYCCRMKREEESMDAFFA